MTQEERWERAYNLLIKYYKEYGDTRIPRKYVVNDVKLGEWLDRQRQAYKNKGSAILTPERRDKLNKLGISWEVNKNKMLSFDDYYSLLEDYHKVYGNIDVPYDYVIDGANLGTWLSRIRHSYKASNGQSLNQEEIDKLNKLGISWEFRNVFSFDHYYSLLKDYYKEYGNIDVSRDYEKNGVKLGSWLHNQREAYKGDITHTITKEEVDKLNELGMNWRFYYVKWTENYKLLEEYYSKHGNIDIPYDYVFKGVYLGYWLSIQCKLYRENDSKLTKTRIIKLNKLGMDWDEENTELLNKNISNFEIYNSILNERVNYILRDFTFERINKIVSLKKQKQIEKELIKRIWR